MPYITINKCTKPYTKYNKQATEEIFTVLHLYEIYKIFKFRSINDCIIYAIKEICIEFWLLQMPLCAWAHPFMLKINTGSILRN